MAYADLAASLRQLALDAGFDRAGVASLASLPSGSRFLEWLADGSQASMAYLERRVERRLNPAMVLPGARSVLCAALQYGAGLEEEDRPGGDLWPGVARYARGRDYHRVMGGMLEKVAQGIEKDHPGSKCRWYVDTGPVLERDLAAAAGIGVVGKNTNLLHPEAGSWFFVGEILTNLEVASSENRIADLCGQCSRCLDACPTGALPEAFRLVADLCISYWTIEHRGAIPAATRPLLGDWVFGCDICQEVCPANELELIPVRTEFEIPEELAGLGLSDVLAFDEHDYRRAFRGSAVKRARFSGLQRNVVIAMGNRGDVGYVAPLARVLRTGDSLLRAHAAWALGQIGGREALSCLRRSLEVERDAAVRSEIEGALQRIDASS